MVNTSSYELVSPIWLSLPEVSVYVQDLLKGLAVYNRLSSTGQVRKQIWKLVAIHAMGQELESELRIWALIRSPDKFKTSLEEAKALANRHCR